MAWLVLSIALMLCSLAVLMFSHEWQRRSQRKAVLLRLEAPSVLAAPTSRTQAWLQRLGRSELVQRLLAMDSETQVLLNRIGWRRAPQHALYVALQWSLPLLLLVMLLAGQAVFSVYPENEAVYVMVAMSLGYLVPKRALAMAAARQQRQLLNEVGIFIPLLRILFDAGLTVEQSVRVISERARTLMPVISRELESSLKRVDSGMDLTEELNELSLIMEVDEFHDCMAILVQLLKQGGGAMNALTALKKLIDERRLTRQQETISKLSGKMSVVMMVLLFPALLIVLAGPGLSAIGRAMGTLG